ncbi:MAG: response regulator [Desulfobulbus sp.]|jgi:DNA-binding response OmpR family regulator|uniref:response regulator n=1 Tax=Desulfobulbus sp. TaxID=895 RepID=UPI002851FBA7|nr:response regulator [Desulfobulbus sp.]MDR2550437.1 response regulator [Desulfobulbus sp.]
MRNKTILLVEDNLQDEMLILRALNKVNIANRIDVIRDGQQAVDFLLNRGAYLQSQLSELPMVVLLDIGLPKLSGLEVLKIIRTNWRTRLLPVVVLTSSDEERDRQRSYEIGANSFVRKPLDFVELADTVSRLSIYWLSINEPPENSP